MLSGKQRATLRAAAHSADTVLMVGKEGVTEALVKAAGEVITARELIKGRVLETSPQPVKEIAETLAEALYGDVVQVIGNRFVLYRRNPELPDLFFS